MKRTIAALLVLGLPIGATPLAAKRLPPSPLEGVWKTDCRPIGKNGRHGFITRLEVKGRALTATTQIYAHNTCDTATVGTAYRGEIVRTAIAADGAIDFDHVVLAVTMTADAPDVVTTYNANDTSGCGMGGGWQIGVPRGVEGRYCAPFTFPAVGVQLYERAWVAGDDLRIGSFPAVWNNTSPDKRPMTPGTMVFHRLTSRRET
ncbi:hypothetical protein [Sphingomonas bacterium]|uniref:hypothetical protein n=1 Tax=Sphingomonas bacterium TaxID=1895847 RepID=UPI002602EABA|nr:hypothetical protein [Sphingomonas bacterium]MDB5680163.1 hypothetical protein [Sphingomonas bacterium]